MYYNVKFKSMELDKKENKLYKG